MATDTHPSARRLLEYARQATARTRHPVNDWRDLLIRLQVSPATMTNWKRRGVSKEGALAAETELGVNASWVLNGSGPVGAASKPTHQAQEPAAPYRSSGPTDAGHVLDGLAQLLAEVPEAMRGAFVDILTAWAKDGARDMNRRATLLHFAGLAEKQPRAARM